MLGLAGGAGLAGCAFAADLHTVCFVVKHGVVAAQKTLAAGEFGPGPVLDGHDEFVIDERPGGSWPSAVSNSPEPSSRRSPVPRGLSSLLPLITTTSPRGVAIPLNFWRLDSKGRGGAAGHSTT